MTQEKTKPIAVAGEEVEKFGCPYCGYRSGSSSISGGGTSIVTCGECHQTYAVLAKGVKRSTIGIGSYYPKLTDHPRWGIPKHGTPDKRPELGGEFFRSRGIGWDYTPGCFVCGGETGLHRNIAAYVQCKEAGERVVAMFPQGARLDYREYEPDYVQVKIGACTKHRRKLERLHNLTVKHEGVILETMVKAVTEGRRFK